MPETNEKSPLDELEGELYERNRTGSIRRSSLHEQGRDIQDAWEHDSSVNKPPMSHKKPHRFVKKILYVAVAFFVVAVAIASFVIFRGGNVVSSSNVDIAVTGPTIVDGGEVLDLDVEVINRNNTALELTDLIVEFPTGTRDPDDVTRELQRTREALGTIDTGGRAKHKVSARVFGQEDEKQEIVVSVEYRVAGSNAIFVKESLFTFEIGTTPISVLIDAPEEVNAGQETTFEVTIVSNSTDVVEDVLLEVTYPFGFLFDSSTPEPEFESNTWLIGDLDPGSRQSVRIRGTLEGQDKEERTFGFAVGLQDTNRPTQIGTPFITASHTVSIARPFVDVSVALNGSADSSVISQSGQNIRADITWRNNLPDVIANVVVEAHLSGSGFDKSRVSVTKGFFNSSNSNITWDKSIDSALSSISPGETGQLSFTFTPKDLSSGIIDGPEILIDITVSGDRRGGSSTSGDIFIALPQKTVRIASDVSLSGRATYSSGPFVNQGPIPPKAETETTYTVVWSVTNSANEVSGAKVTTTLPSYVRWVGKASPSQEDVTFNAVGGTVTWDLGALSSGTGFSSAPKEVAFQVGLLPSLSQIGTAPDITGEIVFVGTDQFTNTGIRNVLRPITTRTTTDPSFQDSDSRVVE